MANTTSGGAAVEPRANLYAAATSGNYQNGANDNINETLPGEVGTPHERIQLLQMEVRNAIKAGLPVRYGNATQGGLPVLVISIANARALMGSGNATFEWLGDVATTLPEDYQKAERNE